MSQSKEVPQNLEMAFRRFHDVMRKLFRVPQKEETWYSVHANTIRRAAAYRPRDVGPRRPQGGNS